MLTDYLTKEQLSQAFADHEREQVLDGWRRSTPAERVQLASVMILSLLPQIVKSREVLAKAGIDHNGRRIGADGFPLPEVTRPPEDGDT